MYELTKFPVRGLVFELGNSMEDLSEAVANACIHLQDENIPYNVLIADRGSRVFVLPQCFAERQARGEVDQEILDTQVPLILQPANLFLSLNGERGSLLITLNSKDV